RKSFFFNVIKPQPLPVPGLDPFHGRTKRHLKKLHVSSAVWIGKRRNDTLRRLMYLPVAIRLIQRFKSLPPPDPVNVPLRKHRAQPGFHRTPSVKIAKERTFSRLAVCKPVEFCEQGIRKLLRFQGSRANS